MSGSRGTAVRDQDASPFSHILMQLCRSTGAHCAALVDGEGETVDYGGQGDPFDIRILAAEWRLVLAQFEASPKLGKVSEIMVRARAKSYWIEALPLGYALVVEMGRRSTKLSERALNQARRALCVEAGFDATSLGKDGWVLVDVREERSRSRRPVSVAMKDQQQQLTVLGRIKSESDREHGYRVRLHTGEECTLVREPLGHWYLEDESWP